MFDPFSMGMMAMTGFNNPELFSQAMALSGVSPGGVPNTLAPQPLQGDSLGGFFTPTLQAQAGGVESPAAQPTMPNNAQATGGTNLGALAGVKTPDPVKPIMNAGVSGAQKAPEAKNSGKSSSDEAIRALLAGRLTGADPLRVPALGALLKGAL
jgi:hypothetical protein